MKEDKIWVVYETINNLNNKNYIGKTWKEKHEISRYMGSGSYFSNALKKHGKENFTSTILKEFEIEDDAYDYEAELVTPEFVKLDTNYNLAPGGKGGVTPSEATRKKLSEAGMGRVCTDATRKKISDAHKGVKHPQWRKDINSEAQKGKKLSEEHKKSVSEAHKGVPKSEKHKENISVGRIGMKFSEEHRKNISNAVKNMSSEKRVEVNREKKETRDNWSDTQRAAAYAHCSNSYIVYDDEMIEQYRFTGGFDKFCKTHGMPVGSMGKTYKDNTKYYPKDKKSITQATKKGFNKFFGWCVRIQEKTVG